MFGSCYKYCYNLACQKSVLMFIIYCRRSAEGAWVWHLRPSSRTVDHCRVCGRGSGRAPHHPGVPGVSLEETIEGHRPTTLPHCQNHSTLHRLQQPAAPQAEGLHVPSQQRRPSHASLFPTKLLHRNRTSRPVHLSFTSSASSLVSVRLSVRPTVTCSASSTHYS